MSITSFLPPVCPYFNKNTDQVAKRWNEPSSVNPNFSSSPQNSFSLLFRSVYLGGESEVLAFFQGLLTSDVSIIIIVLLLGLYRISVLFWYPVSGRISGFIYRISGWPDNRISDSNNCFKTKQFWQIKLYLFITETL